MNKLLIFLLFLNSLLIAEECGPDDPAYKTAVKSSFPSTLVDRSFHQSVLKKIGERLPELVNYPALKYPNKDYTDVLERFPQDKILVFGYGSLMNKQSAARSIKQDAIDSMHPAIAFGVKRIFNYQATKTDHWGSNQDAKEKAMLNLTSSFDQSSMANGLLMQVDKQDLMNLIKRETGYDLVPILVVSWNDVINRNPNLEVQIAYTFVAVEELREHIDYTSTEFYPVRGYLKAVQEGAAAYGEDFYKFWNTTTFLADGTTTVERWDKETFKGILCTKRPQ